MSIDIPVFRLQVEPELEAAIKEAIDRVLARRRFVLGDEVAAFENEFATYCGARECVTVANGTDALELALRGIGIGRGDCVATAANAGHYTSTALAAIGAVPVYLDVDPGTLTLSPSALAAHLDAIKAVVVTHLYGQMAAIDDLARLAAAKSLPVIEDCAQAHGAMHNGRRAGTFGVAGCYSFYPTKNLGALGDGGAIVTSDADLGARLRALRQYGWTTKYHVGVPGGRNSRLDELQAAVLRSKLPWLDRWNAQRVALAQRYRHALAGLPLLLPEWTTGEYVAHLFVVRADDREALRTHLATAGIGTDVHYPVPDYRQLKAADADIDALSVTEEACRTVTTLPCFPGLAAEHQDRVADAVRRYYRKDLRP